MPPSIEISSKNDMHSCLRIAEIQKQIFASLTQHDCASLARTCSTFYDQATDFVWIKVETFVPFIRCMPSEILVLRNVAHPSSLGNKVTSISFSREPQSTDWQLFCKYAHRVKIFTDLAPGIADCKIHEGEHEVTYQLTNDAINTLTLFICQQNCLFPRLETLIVKHLLNRRWLPKYLLYICRHTLQSMTLRRGAGPMNPAMYVDWTEMMSDIHPVWPRLPSVDPNTHIASDDQQPSALNQPESTQISAPYLEDFSHLQGFGGSVALHPLLLYRLSRLCFLHVLEISDLEDDYHVTYDIKSPQLSSQCFPSLRDLRIASYSYAHEPRSLIPLLRVLGNSRTLIHVHINVQRCALPLVQEPAVSLRTLLEPISQIPLLQKLHLSLSSPASADPARDLNGRAAFVLTGQLLSMLFPLQHMRDLKLFVALDVTLEDHDLRDVALAWPNLQKLYIQCRGWKYHAGSSPPRTTLVGVQALYHGCPYLQKVDVAVNDSLPTINDSGNTTLNLPTADNKLRNHSMQNLRVRLILLRGDFLHKRSWKATRILAIATCIMFPLVERFSPDPAEGFEVWKQCSQMEPSQVHPLLDQVWAEAEEAD